MEYFIHFVDCFLWKLRYILIIHSWLSIAMHFLILNSVALSTKMAYFKTKHLDIPCKMEMCEKMDNS